LPLLLDPEAGLGMASLPAEAPSSITLLIGPEGGFAPSERAAALRAGFQAVRLGSRVLRTETAPLAAIAALQARWGDFR
jgi:16S rRNA (uracil1498-N3)-methyltransferase